MPLTPSDSSQFARRLALHLKRIGCLFQLYKGVSEHMDALTANYLVHRNLRRKTCESPASTSAQFAVIAPPHP